MRGLRRAAIGSVGLACALLGWTGDAHAEPSAEDKGLANVLFQEGRALMAAGQIPEACQKLEESQRLDPSGGTILNLALCHEREGRLARSWSEFSDAMAVARRDGRQDRETEAATHVLALGPRLSRLTIVVPPATRVAGLRIERNGREVGEAAWSTPIPVDGGEHVVRATAPGREPYSTTVAIEPEADAQTVAIPVLAISAVVVEPPRVEAPAAPTPPPTPVITPERLRWAGIGSAGAGVVLLGTAGWALASALNLHEESNPFCDGDMCDDPGLKKRNEAVSRGNLATILGISGAVLVGAGVTLYYFGRRASVPKREARADVHFMLGATPRAALAGIEGRF